MQHRNIKCNDCHEPHNLRTKQKGNLLCLQCHDHQVYDTEQHHFHQKTGKGRSAVMTENGFYDQGDGTQCVDCHMTGAKFMGVDFRRDHSFRIPRPDVGEKTNSPDACTSCHQDMNPKKAMEILKEWYPESNYKTHYGELFYEIANGNSEAVNDLIPMIMDTGIASTIKASSLTFIARTNSLEGQEKIEELLESDDPIIRYAAVESYWNYDPEVTIKKIEPFLNDSLKAIRIAALLKLASVNYESSDSIGKFTLDQVEEEYVDYLHYAADFANSRHNLGIYYARRGDTKSAIYHLKEAIKIDDQYYPAMLEMAIIYSQSGNNPQAEKWLLYTLANDPKNLRALRYIALLKAEFKEYESAASYFDQLIDLDPNNARNYYNLGFVNDELGKLDEAETCFIKTVELVPTSRDYLYALAYFYAKHDQGKKAFIVVNKMMQLFPNDPQVKQFYNSLKGNNS